MWNEKKTWLLPTSKVQKSHYEETVSLTVWKIAFLKLRKMFNSFFRSGENQSLEFYIFRFHDVIKCLSIKQEIILLNNLGSKQSLLMKFGQIMSYYKRITTKNSTKSATGLPPNYPLKISWLFPDPYCFALTKINNYISIAGDIVELHQMQYLQPLPLKSLKNPFCVLFC